LFHREVVELGGSEDSDEDGGDGEHDDYDLCNICGGDTGVLYLCDGCLGEGLYSKTTPRNLNV